MNGRPRNLIGALVAMALLASFALACGEAPDTQKPVNEARLTYEAFMSSVGSTAQTPGRPSEPWIVAPLDMSEVQGQFVVKGWSVVARDMPGAGQGSAAQVDVFGIPADQLGSKPVADACVPTYLLGSAQVSDSRDWSLQVDGTKCKPGITVLVARTIIGSKAGWPSSVRVVRIAPDAQAPTLPKTASGSLQVPVFSQNDPAYAGDLGYVPDEFSQYGCGVTALAMVMKYLGVDTDPRALNDSLRDQVGFTSAPPSDPLADQLTWSSPSVRAASNGTVDVTHVIKGSVDWSVVDSELASGRPVIVFMKNAHYVVVVGHTGGQYYVNDPYPYPARQNIPLEDNVVHGGPSAATELITFSGQAP